MPDPLTGWERDCEKLAQGIATAELAVLTLRGRRVRDRRSVTGEAWLRRQLAGLDAS